MLYRTAIVVKYGKLSDKIVRHIHSNHKRRNLEVKKEKEAVFEVFETVGGLARMLYRNDPRRNRDAAFIYVFENDINVDIRKRSLDLAKQTKIPFGILSVETCADIDAPFSKCENRIIRARGGIPHHTMV